MYPPVRQFESYPLAQYLQRRALTAAAPTPRRRPRVVARMRPKAA